MTKPRSFSRHDFQTLGLLALIGLGAFAGWNLWQNRSRAAQETRQRRACMSELRQLGERRDDGDLAAEIARAEQALAAARESSGLFVAASVEPPAASSPYFELAHQLAQWREQVRAAGLGVKADERFGFAAQTVSRAEAGQRVRLRRQIRAMDRIVEAFVNAHPEQVLSWQFVEPNADIVAPCVAGGLVGAETVRVNFSGSTASLRAVLNGLAKAAPAWVVHSVDARRQNAGHVPSVAAPLRGEAEAASLVLRSEPELPLAGSPPSERVLDAGSMRFEITASAVEWVGPARPTAPAGLSREAPWGGPNRDEAKSFALFTPPTLWFDESAGGWTTRTDRAPETVPSVLALKVISVESELFRLQLGGFIGEATDGRGAFRNQETGETFLAPAGAELPELGIRILQITRDAARAETVARVLDERSGEEVELSDLRPRETGVSVAEVEMSGGRRRVREGDAFACAGIFYRIRAVKASPGSVEVEAESPAWAERVVRTLQSAPPLTFTP